MSMLSAQCDELRELAGDGSMEWVAGPVRASVLREAADTIWELRDDLQQANAENAKLREVISDGEESAVLCINYAYLEALDVLLENLKAENAKLRELLQRALTSHDKMCTNRGTCLGCLLFNAKPFMPACPIVGVTRDARELGVEVG